MASTIGIKIANGEFYSIIEENSAVKKRLILTTVHDKQRSVQIDLYKSFTKTMADALYIGSLVVENIKPKPKGEPSIELVISSTANGDITADAIDLDTTSKGEHQVLTVSLKSLDEDNREYEIPDFELEQHEGPPTGLYEKAEAAKDQEPKKFPILVVVLVGLILILALVALWFFLFRGRGIGFFEKKDRVEVTSPVNPPAAEEVPVNQPAQPPARTAPAAQTPPIIQAPPVRQTPPEPVVNRTRPPAPVSSYTVPAVIPRDGAPYKIRWGDTLWDISEAFYRNPWLYPRIARFNNIRNPDLIISGRTIRIPPQN
jgi:LysM repeat protein